MIGFCQSSVVSTESSQQIHVSIPEVSLVRVVGSSAINLNLTPPSEAGNAISSTDLDSNCWINYSVVKGGLTRPQSHIYARIDQGVIPPGVDLTVYAKPYQGVGKGVVGKPAGLVKLSNTEQVVIENIQTSYTGQGQGNGHQLVYQLTVNNNDYHLLDFQQSQEVSVVYTISD